MEGARMNRNFSTWIVQRRSILVGVILALIIGVGIGYSLWHSNSSPFHSAQFQCPEPNAGGVCPYEFTFLSGQVNVTEGLPYVILFSGDGLYTSTAGIFYENAHYGYGLYIPINDAFYGGTITTVNGTTYPSGSIFPISYSVTIRYYLTNSTMRTCTPQPNNITLALSENQQQSFSC
jgi:hypothetical protein